MQLLANSHLRQKRKTAQKAFKWLSCAVFAWSWQCASNTRPADYEPDSGVKNKVRQAFSALLQHLRQQVSAHFPSAVTRIFPGMGQDVGQQQKISSEKESQNLWDSKQSIQDFKDYIFLLHSDFCIFLVVFSLLQ